jgi:hypothetical protein
VATRIMNSSGTYIGDDIPSVVKWVFYNNGKIIFTHTSYDLPAKVVHPEILLAAADRIFIDTPKRAIKENLNRTDTYWMKHTERFGIGEQCALYIYVPRFKEGTATEDHKTTIQHYRTVELPIKCGIQGSLQICDALKVREYLRSDETEFGKQVEMFKLGLEADGIDCDRFDIAKFLSLYNMPERKNTPRYVIRNDSNIRAWIDAGKSIDDLPEPEEVRINLEKALELTRAGMIDTHWTANDPEGMGNVVFRVTREFKEQNPETYWEIIQGHKQ